MAETPGKPTLAELLARSRRLRMRLTKLRERSATLQHEIEDAHRIDNRTQFAPPPLAERPQPMDPPPP